MYGDYWNECTRCMEHYDSCICGTPRDPWFPLDSARQVKELRFQYEVNQEITERHPERAEKRAKANDEIRVFLGTLLTT
jgi:hypothetical protein